MTTLRKGDNDLHYEDGTHRGTPPTTDGHQLDLYEARIRRHLAEHEANKAATDRRCACAHNTDGASDEAAAIATIMRVEGCQRRAIEQVIVKGGE